MKGRAEQINGREGETATLFWMLSFLFIVFRWRFRPTSSQSLNVSLVKNPRCAATKVGRKAQRTD